MYVVMNIARMGLYVSHIVMDISVNVHQDGRVDTVQRRSRLVTWHPV